LAAAGSGLFFEVRHGARLVWKACGTAPAFKFSPRVGANQTRPKQRAREYLPRTTHDIKREHSTG
jgi:hypothetical protein